MNKKQETIINGIDVSECKFYEPKAEIMTCHEESITKRCDKTNCYFKQFKRLQEENEKLKADLEGETEQCQKWYQLETDKHFQMLKYEQALEEIRNEIGDLKNINRLINLQKILDIINEVLNDRD